MQKVFGRIKGKNFANVAAGALSSRAFPFFTAAVVTACYYLGWDMVSIYYLGIITVLMILFLNDLTPLVSNLLFFSVMVSVSHSPSEKVTAEVPGYFSQPANLALAGVMLGLIIIAAAWRLAVAVKDKKYKPSAVFFGLCGLAAAFILSGIGKQDYSAYDFLYGLIMAAVYFGLFALIASGVEPCGENYIKICFGFTALSVMLACELIAVYISNGSAMLDGSGEIIKEKVVFGWGIWNTMGMLLTLCVPAVMMLSAKFKHGYLFIFYATFLAVLVFLTTSRQAMVGVAVVYPLSLVLALIKSRNKKTAIISVSGILAIGVIIIIAKWGSIARLLGSVLNGMFNKDGSLSGNGRISLINTAMRFFIKNPAFGSGFFLDYNDCDYTGLNFVPEMACNTFAELFAACGMAGLLAYLVHRVQTFVAFAAKPDSNKSFIALIISGLLIMSLFDNHMFYILPNLIYSSLLPFALGDACGGRAPLGGLLERADKKT